MDSYIDTLITDLETQLRFIELEENSLLKRAEASIMVCDKALNQLKEYITKKGFKNKQEEIDFFRISKPKVESKLKLFVVLFNIEKRKPISNVAQKHFFEKELNEIDYYIQTNLEFYTYYKIGSTHFDDKYFIRGKGDIHMLLDDCYFSYDKTFNTTHDSKVAKIIAYDLIGLYLKNQLSRLEKNEGLEQNTQHNKNIAWTESKVAFIEMLYALHTTGCFNRGNLDLKELSEHLSEMFNVEPGDIYRTYAEIKQRKDPTKFLDTLRENLLKKIQEDLK